MMPPTTPPSTANSRGLSGKVLAYLMDEARDRQVWEPDAVGTVACARLLRQDLVSNGSLPRSQHLGNNPARERIGDFRIK